MYQDFILSPNIPLYDICNIVFIHSSVDGQLGCFYNVTIMSNDAVNLHVQIFVWTYVFISLG